MPNVSRAVRVGGRLACLISVCLLPVLTTVGSRAEQPEPQEPAPPVFRGGVEFVSVDVFPRRDGMVIEGLRAEDFEVLEDGTPQTIATFEFVRIEPNPLDSERRDPVSQADGDRQAAEPRNRVFVVYLDLANTTIAGGHDGRQPIVDFLRRTIGVRDLFGVMTAETPAAQLVFGRRLESIEGELARHWTWGQADRLSSFVGPRSDYEERLFNCVDYVDAGTLQRLSSSSEATDGHRGLEGLLRDLHREDQLVSSLEALMLRLGGLRDERKNVLFISEGWVPRGPRDELRNLTVGRGQLPVVGVGPGGRMGLGQTQREDVGDVTWCDAEIARLGGTDFEARFRHLLESARQANVSFYPIDVGGLRTTSRPGGSVDTLRTLAENTDGFAVVGTNDLTGAVRRIERDLSAFYLLGYNSTNTAANGRFRRIEVRVGQPDVQISARRGYFAMTPELAAAATAPRDGSGPTPLDLALARLEIVRSDADLFVTGAAGAHGIDVTVEVAAAAVKREGWEAGTTIDVSVTGADGRASAARVDVAAGQRGTRLTLPANGIGTAPWLVRVDAMGRDGRLQQQVEIPPAPDARLVGSPAAFRGARALRAPLQPLADARLSRLERLRVEWPVLAEADHTARLLDRTGQPLGQPLPFASLPADTPAVAVDLPMGSLPEGDYVVELIATRDDHTERRLLAFRVVR